MSKNIVNTMLMIAALSSAAVFAETPECTQAKADAEQAEQAVQEAWNYYEQESDAARAAEQTYNTCITTTRSYCNSEWNEYSDANTAAINARSAWSDADFQATMATRAAETAC